MVSKSNTPRVGGFAASEHDGILVSSADGETILERNEPRDIDEARTLRVLEKSIDEPTLSNVLAHCRGIHARVAEIVGVDPSYVSRVAGGSRNNDKISDALREELRTLSESINSLLAKSA